MEQEINALIQRASIDLKIRPSNRKTIMNNYELIYAALKKGGYTEFVAHQWTVLKLSTIHGSQKVKNAVQYGSRN
jgi:hypothetical protein